jgi:Domain of unknown function (DUF4835)
MRILITVFCCAFLSVFVQAQEFVASVRINTPQLQRTDRKVFDVLEGAIREFLNNTKFTEDAYETDERIKINVTITINNEIGDNTFSGEMAIQSSRPVYGSGYETPLLTHLDKDLIFQYDIYGPLQFSKDVIDNNLTAIFGFYAYIILAMDYDSFAPLGGDAHVLSAQQVLNNVPAPMAAAFNGWKANDGGKSRNRYWIVENLIAPRVRPYRSALYTYHRKGLDQMYADPAKAREQVLVALEDLDKVNTAYINSMILTMFTNAKREELVEMWKQGTKQQRERVYEILTKIDPVSAQRYREIGI